MSSQRTEHTRFKVASLPRSFDPKMRLAEADQVEVDARFFGKTLGKKDGYIYVETDRGVYQFKLEYINDIRPLHAELDMLAISPEAKFIVHGTIAQEIQLIAEDEHNRVSDNEILEMARNQNSLKEIVDTLGGLGTREWRG